MKTINFTLLKLTLAFSLGIVLEFFFNFPFTWVVCTTVIILFLTGLFIFKARSRSLIFSVLCISAFIGLGIIALNNQYGLHFKNHYSHYISNTQPQIAQFKIQDILKPNAYYKSYVVDIVKLDNHPTSGKLVLSLPIQYTKDFIPDYLYSASLYISKPNQPINPNEFNYKKYLKKQGVFHQAKADTTQILKVASEQKSLAGFAFSVRSKLNENLSKHNFSLNNLALINALFLGQRQLISEDTYSDFINAGVVHILAISGLHIGILLILLQQLFKPLLYFKKGRLLQLVLTLIILWGFAVLSGLSASTVRSVTMFSIVAIGYNIKHRVIVYNTLIASAFVLLIINPLFIFDVGFQLSYCAVLSILILQPKLEKLFSLQYKLPLYIWKTFTVTLAAQLGLLPLSLYYFHQFPGLFFISNLVIIPFLGIILTLGFGCLVLVNFNILPKLLAYGFSILLNYLESFIAYIASFEAFVITEIPFNGFQLIAAYMAGIMLIFWLLKRNYRYGVWCLVAIIGFQFSIISARQLSVGSEFIIYSTYNRPFASLRINRGLYVFSESDSLTPKEHAIVSDYRTQNPIKTTKILPLKDVIKHQSKFIFRIDSAGIFTSDNIDILWLSYSPKINLNRVLQQMTPKIVIADATNYNSYVSRWKITCRETKTPFYDISQNGAYINR